MSKFIIRGCLFNKLIFNFLPHISFIWRIFSRWVTAWWSRGWAKIKVFTNENSSYNCYQIVRPTLCGGDKIALFKIREKYWIVQGQQNVTQNNKVTAKDVRNICKHTDGNANWLSWRKGRVTKIIESRDNKVRAVELSQKDQINSVELKLSLITIGYVQFYIPFNIWLP